MKDLEKDYLVNLLKRFSGLYFVEVLGFCCMDNHFYFLIRMHSDSDYTDKEIQERFERFYAEIGDGKDFIDYEIPYLRKKLSSLSEFVREIKLGFSRFYNKRHHRIGFLGGGRFKRVVVENGKTLINCLAYIDLNPVRANIIEKPEDYRWNSIGYHIQTGNDGDFLSLDFGLKAHGVSDAGDRLREYRRFLYETGAIDNIKGQHIKQEVLEKEREKDFKITRADRFKSRSRYFSDSGIIGTKAFVQENYQRIKHLFQSTNEKSPKPISGLDGIYSLKRLIE
jgi:REP element-mobilizing transposase RayT